MEPEANDHCVHRYTCKIVRLKDLDKLEPDIWVHFFCVWYLESLKNVKVSTDPLKISYKIHQKGVISYQIITNL